MTELYLLILFILFSSYFSGIEIAIYCINRVRLQYKVDRGIRSARIIKRLLEDPQSLICTILIGNNIMNYLAAATFTNIMSKNMSQANPELDCNSDPGANYAGFCRGYAEEYLPEKGRHISLHRITKCQIFFTTIPSFSVRFERC